jgi:hypothetical protein
MPLGLKRFSMSAKSPSGYPNEKEQNLTTTDSSNAPSLAPTGETAAPPTYTAVDENNAPTDGPSLEDFSGAFASLKINAIPLDFPDNDLAMAHLKVLEAFFVLKQDIGYTDGLFDLWDSRAPGTEESVAGDQGATQSRLEALSKIREKRWALYVARATDRFETWWEKVLTKMEPGHMLTQADMWTSYFQDFPGLGGCQRWTPEMLPPLGKCPLQQQSDKKDADYSIRCTYGVALIHAQPTKLP